MLDRQRKYNIPLHLILLFCLLVIGIVTSGYVLHATQKAEFKKREYNNLSSIADLKVREIVNWRKERLADAHVVQQNLPAIHRIRQFLENPSTDEIRQELLSWMKSLRESNQYGSVVVLDTKKQVGLTNYPYPQYREKCRQPGAKYFFDKVTEIESFVKALRILAQDSSQGELPL
jgi:hypothetical protein